MAVLLAFLFLAPAGFAAADGTPHHVNVDADGYAIARHDPVAYFTVGRPVRGKTAFTARYKGAKYAFSTAANRDRFLANPAKYAPQYGGYCAYGAVYGTKSDIDPNLWAIVDGRLYFLINPGTMSIWAKKKKSYIRDADNAWKTITAAN